MNKLILLALNNLNLTKNIIIFITKKCYNFKVLEEKIVVIKEGLQEKNYLSNFEKMQGTEGTILAMSTDHRGNIYVADTSTFEKTKFTVKVAKANTNKFTKILARLPNPPIILKIDSIGNVYAGINFSYGLWKCHHNETTFKPITEGISIFALGIDKNDNVYYPGYIDFIPDADKDVIYKYDPKNSQVTEEKVEFPGIPKGFLSSSPSFYYW